MPSSPFITNLILFSPLLLIGLLILMILDRAERLRRGAGLVVEHEQEEQVRPMEGGEGEGEGEGEEAALVPDDDDGGGPQEDPQQEPEDREWDVVEDNNLDPTDPTNPPPQPQPQHRTPRAPRAIGPKKAASLARRDQRRAYHEFVRTRALAERESARALEAEREPALFEERRRRALVEEEIAARKEAERKERMRREEEERRREERERAKMKEMVEGMGRGKERKVCTLEEIRTEVAPERGVQWVREGLEREGLLGVRQGGDGKWEMRMVTGKGYYVVLGEREVVEVFAKLDSKGGQGLSWLEMGGVLEEMLGVGGE